MTADLTRRELAALAAVADGLTTSQIATWLDISASVADARISTAASKLGVHGRHAAVAEAVRRGLLAPGPDGYTVQARDTGPLTARQWRVLRLVARGHTTDAAARALGVSPHTAKTHLQVAYRALGARSAPHAVALAMARGLLTPADIDPATREDAA